MSEVQQPDQHPTPRPPAPSAVALRSRRRRPRLPSSPGRRRRAPARRLRPGRRRRSCAGSPPGPAPTTAAGFRWWWPHGAVDPREVAREVDQVADAGFGALEIADVTHSLYARGITSTWTGRAGARPSWVAGVKAALDRAARHDDPHRHHRRPVLAGGRPHRHARRRRRLLRAGPRPGRVARRRRVVRRPRCPTPVVAPRVREHAARAGRRAGLPRPRRPGQGRHRRSTPPRTST